MGDKYKHADGWTSDETFRSMRRNAEQYKKICKENIQLKEDLEFYKSIFQKQSNSAIFNLRIKTINGKRIWVDKVKIKSNGNVLPSDVIIPARTMQELQRLIPEIESEIKFSIS